MNATLFPRVTEILQHVGLAPDYSDVPPAILERAAARGTAVHAAIADHIAGALWGVEPEIRGYIDAYERFRAETSYEPTTNIPTECCNPDYPGETEIIHPEWRYVGHIDPGGIGWMSGGERWLVDWKCVAQLSPRAAYQLAAYRILWHRLRPEEPIARSAAIQLKPSGDYSVYEPARARAGVRVTEAEAEQVFLAALTIYHAVQRHTRTKT